MTRPADATTPDPAQLGVVILPGPACRCAVAFGADGLLGVRILATDEDAGTAALEASVRERLPGAPALRAITPRGSVAEDIARLARHLSHGDVDVRRIRIDWRGASPFRVRVSELARAIPAGRVRTYGSIALELASAARSVGRAMATNPFAVVVPCHRVVGARGDAGGFSAPGGLSTKEALLRLEGGQLAAAPAPAVDGAARQLALRY